jgi:hypothetical protein
MRLKKYKRVMSRILYARIIFITYHASTHGDKNGGDAAEEEQGFSLLRCFLTRQFLHPQDND